MGSEFDLVLDSAEFFFNGKVYKKCIGLKDGKITKIKGLLKAEKRIRCSRKFVLPGLIDVHVHFRVPGQEKKEDWQHGSKAALSGGITTVLDMPNNKPSICTAEELEKKRAIVEKKARVNFGLHFGVSPKHLNEIEKAKNFAALKVFMGSSTGSLLVDKSIEQKKAFSLAAQLKKIAMVHAEDEEIIKKNLIKAKENNKNDIRFHSLIRSVEAEIKAVKQAIALQKECGNRLHVCHVSSAKTVDLLRKEKLENKNISCAVTPHHLFLSEDDAVKLGNFAKVNPSIKSKADRRALWNALLNGTIDVIASDHAPHSFDEKNTDFFNAPSGVPGIETMLPLLLNAVNSKLLSLKKVVECCCINPAKLFKLKGKGKIFVGMDADLVLVDLKKEHKIEKDRLFTKCGWSPFEGWKLKGSVDSTFLSGELVFDGEQVVSNKKGLELQF